MTQAHNLSTTPIHRAPLGKRMLQGAGFALILISLFLFPIDNADPSWPRFWMVKPLLVVPIAGSLGGAFYYFMDHLRCQGGWKTVAAYVLSLVGFVVVLWLGTVLGLNGTLWD